MFIATAAERTKHIRLGTGVVSLPITTGVGRRPLGLLDHLTRGQLIFGAGPGALPTDAFIMGIDPVNQRPMMEQSLEAILALLRTDEPVTPLRKKTDWFSLLEGRLQVRPYTQPHFEVAVAAMVSPSGPRLAGKYGECRCCRCRCRGGRRLRRHRPGQMGCRRGSGGQGRGQGARAGSPHVAGEGRQHASGQETHDQAIEDCTYGLEDFANYFGGGPGFVPLGGVVDDQPKSPREFVET